MVYLDVAVENDLYRCLGTITDIRTVNSSFNAQMESVTLDHPDLPTGKDLRKLEFNIQATFQKESGSQNWIKYSSVLPTSPSTLQPVCLLTEDTVMELVDDEIYPTIGHFRGMGTAPQPLNIPDFGSEVGASHTAVIGKSGSGKTAMYTYMLAGAMKHEQHAIMVIDPQGQWATENGMVISPQKFATGLGRDVSVLRVAEDIKLPMNEDIFTRMLQELKLWRKFRRMGAENLEAFSDAVSTRIARADHKKYDQSPRDLLSTVFKEIAESDSAMNRIYTRGDRQDDFKRDLLMLAGEPIIDEETGEQELIEQSDLDDVEENWNAILSVFTPLINLFSSKNITGNRRRPLGGQTGFLKDVFQIRNPKSTPAPYVVLDMSPSVALHAKSELLQGSDNVVNMQTILDNQDIKALIIIMVLDEMKRASEIAFAAGGGNLNTQIVFDEAWRYAPEGKATPTIEELAKKLEGFALDTRKFGIGWTYILQSPADLKQGIWKQLTYVHVGYGLVGEDVRRLESLTDDVKQIDLYRQFIPPKSTGIYPFMLMGPISPVIFTTAPAFVNVFNKTEDFLHTNQKWVTEITTKRSLPTLTLQYLTQKQVTQKPSTSAGAPKSYSVGKNPGTKKSTPQTLLNEPTNIDPPAETTGLIEEMPF